MEEERTLDFFELRKQLIKEMRGDKSQNYVNNKMGYSFNQCYKWESGAKKILWTEFCQFAEALGIDLLHDLKRLLRYHGKIDDYKSLVITICKGRSAADISRDSGITRDRIGRWLNGKASPDLEDIFKLITTYCPTTLISLLFFWVDYKNVDILYDTFGNLIEFNQFFSEHPYAYAINRCFELDSYHQLEVHSSEFVAKQLDLSIDEVENCIEKMREKKIIYITKDKKYKPSVKDFAIRLSFKFSRPIREYHLQKTTDFIRNTGEEWRSDCAQYYDVYACSTEEINFIQKRIFSLFHELRQMVDEHDDDDNHFKDKVRIFTMSLIDPGPSDKD